MRVLGLDVGTKRIGVAMSDAMGIIASPLEVVLREPEKYAINRIKEICIKNDIKTIVVGLPKNMNNSIGSQAQDCMDFAKNFETEYHIVFEDERLTSYQAERNLTEVGKKWTKNKGLIDKESARIILQQYLDKVV